MEAIAARPYLREAVYEKVRTLLLDRLVHLREPTRVHEEDIADRLGVSRTPVREALVRLAHEGVVAFRPRRGAVLLPVNRKEYFDWLRVREELEGFAARTAALSASPSDIRRLRELFTGFAAEGGSSGRSADYALANVRFHETLIGFADNIVLERIWQSFGHRQMLKGRTIEKLDRADASLREHLAIIDAIEARDAPLAERLAREHVRSLHADAQRAFDSLEAGFSLEDSP